MINAKKQRKTTEWERLDISSRKLEILRENFQVYAPTSNAEETEVERLYEDLQDLLELTPKNDVLFITGDWNVKVRSQDILGVTSKFGLGV